MSAKESIYTCKFQISNRVYFKYSHGQRVFFTFLGVSSLFADALFLIPIASVVPLHPEKVWEDVSPGFLVTFWSLTLYDLCVPNEAYKREINKLKAQSTAMGDSKQAVSFCILLINV